MILEIDSDLCVLKAYLKKANLYIFFSFNIIWVYFAYYILISLELALEL